MAVVAPDCTSTETGTVKAEARLLERDTVVPLAGAALESAAVQVVEADAAKLVFPHCSEVIVMGALMEKVAEALDVPTEAVTVTF